MSDESMRHQATHAQATPVPAPGSSPDPLGRRLSEIGRDDALALLGSVSIGRIVFTSNALPAVRPVNHILDEGQIVVRTHGDSALARQTAGSGIGGVVVAYEADQLDPATHQGWSVVVTGYARRVTDPRLLARYQQLLTAWVDIAADHVIRIRPDIVAAFRLA